MIAARTALGTGVVEIPPPVRPADIWTHGDWIVRGVDFAELERKTLAAGIVYGRQWGKTSLAARQLCKLLTFGERTMGAIRP